MHMQWRMWMLKTVGELEEQDVVSKTDKKKTLGDACPDCGGTPLVHQAGCEHCAICGYSGCSA